jgi:hypothetical protein
MKNFFITLLAGLLPCAALADGTPTAPASQAEVNAGTVTHKYVSPSTLAGASSDLAGCLHDIGQSAVASSFVDGFVFKPRFGLTNTVLGRAFTGAASNFTPDGWGLQVTNGISLTLPYQVSNVTVVVTYRAATASSTMTLFALGNATTKSSIEVEDTGDGLFQAWENYRGGFYNGRVNPNGTNLLNPLIISSWNYSHNQDTAIEPKVLAFVRDVNATWTCYQDSVQAKWGLAGSFTPVFTITIPTNALDPLDTLWLGTSGVTNTTYNNIGTNGIISSIFLFATTNVAAALEGYRASLWVEDTDTIDLWMGDSLLAENGNGNGTQISAPWYYAQKYPKHVFRNYSFSGSFLSSQTTWQSSGGFGILTNAPGAKYKHLNFFDGAGVNDEYQSSSAPSALFTSLTNISIPMANAGATVTWIDVAQIATNATAPYAYSLAKETNSFLFNQLVRTNTSIGIARYVPRRDFCVQNILRTNGLFSIDGIHPFQRTNFTYNAALADLINGEQFNITSNTFVAP